MRHAQSAGSVLLVLVGSLFAQDQRRFGADSPHRGLPRDAESFAPYHQDSAHATNRIFRSLWLRQMAPAEVAAPADNPPLAQFRSGWVHQKRAGTADDTRWYGGDGRLLPLEGLAEPDAKALAGLLGALTPDSTTVRELQASKALAVLFQHDLLRAAERLRDTGANPELLPALRRAAQAMALPGPALATIDDPLRTVLTSADGATLRRELPQQLGGDDGSFHEILRRSTRLFDAEKTLLWSRVFLSHPDGKDALQALLPPAGSDGKGKGKGPTAPLGLRAVLVQGIVAFDRDGAPHATPLVFDLRTQVLVDRAPLSSDNPTFSRDGIDFGIWQLEREGLRRGAPAAFFRRIEADDRDLFRDYGTAKLTTYRGQCSLCHRLSDTPEPDLGGFPVLRPHVQAKFATTGDERLRLAEEQAARLWSAISK